jgi:hypothetical protein
MQEQHYAVLMSKIRGHLDYGHRESPLLRNVLASYELHESHIARHVLFSYAREPGVDITEWEPKAATDAHSVEPASDDKSSLKWVAENLSELAKRYGDRWILVDNEKVVGDSTDISALLQQAFQQGIVSPLIIDMQSPSVTSRAVYNACQVV